MLRVVKQAIDEEINNDENFHTFYLKYLQQVQDDNIEFEFQFLVKRNQLNIDIMQRLIQNTYERLEFIHGKNCGDVAKGL